MAYIDGDNLINGAILSYQEVNRIKNNWRASSAPANVQAGMIFSDSDDDRLYHRGVAALEEILQATRSRTVANVQLTMLEIKYINAVCVDNNVVCVNNSIVFLATF
jgi:hypothetical protein